MIGPFALVLSAGLVGGVRHQTGLPCAVLPNHPSSAGWHPAGSPTLAVGAQSRAWFGSIETSPAFVEATSCSPGPLELIAASTGLSWGSAAVRFGPYLTAGTNLAGGGLRAVVRLARGTEGPAPVIRRLQRDGFSVDDELAASRGIGHAELDCELRLAAMYPGVFQAMVLVDGLPFRRDR